HRLARVLLAHALHLEEHAARTDDRHPLLGRSLALAHARLLGLLRDRLVGEDAHPDLAAARDEASHGDACRLDLTIGQPAWLERLQPVVAERHLTAAPRLATHAAALLLAVLDLLGHQHCSIFSYFSRGPTPARCRRLRSGSWL